MTDISKYNNASQFVPTPGSSKPSEKVSSNNSAGAANAPSSASSTLPADKYYALASVKAQQDSMGQVKTVAAATQAPDGLNELFNQIHTSLLTEFPQRYTAMAPEAQKNLVYQVANTYMDKNPIVPPNASSANNPPGSQADLLL